MTTQLVMIEFHNTCSSKDITKY